MSDLQKFLEEIQTEKFKPYETGVKFFDDLLEGGVVKESLLLLLAAPGAGKTTLCMQIAESLAERGTPVCYLNLEMSRNQMLAKVISHRLTKKYVLSESDFRMTATEILQGYNWKDDAAKMAAVTDVVNHYSDYVYPKIKYNPEGVGANLSDIKAFLDKMLLRKAEEGKQAPVIVLDYLHLVTSKEYGDVKEIIKAVVTMLKEYAMKAETFVFAICAVGRDKKNKLDMSAGRDSSTLEYAADCVLTLDYKRSGQDEEDNLGVPDENGFLKMVLKLEKSRHSTPKTRQDVYFDSAFNTFYGRGEWMKLSKKVKRENQTKKDPKQFDIVL